VQRDVPEDSVDEEGDPPDRGEVAVELPEARQAPDLARVLSRAYCSVNGVNPGDPRATTASAPLERTWA
jgi:hypothetical protein